MISICSACCTSSRWRCDVPSIAAEVEQISWTACLHTKLLDSAQQVDFSVQHCAGRQDKSDWWHIASNTRTAAAVSHCFDKINQQHPGDHCLRNLVPCLNTPMTRVKSDTVCLCSEAAASVAQVMHNKHNVNACSQHGFLEC